MSEIIDCEMRIGDEVFVHGYIDEIRKDVIIIRNEGGYFGTVPSEMFYYEEDINGYGTMNEADTPQTDWEKEKSEKSLCNSCGKDCDNRKRNLYTVECNRYEPQTDCGWK